jgi:mRNA-degrading endonuclease RelE of RelBE toxin-antitoxin system
MSYKIKTIPSFDKDVKVLSKKYKSFKSDLIKLREILSDNPKSGTPIGNSCYKIRITIASKNKGKSGGDRVITHVLSINELEGIVYLLAVYDKSEQENITDNEIRSLLKEITLS